MVISRVSADAPSAGGANVGLMSTLTRPRPAALAGGALEKALEHAWERSTSADPGNWGSANPAWGQCAVTALIVQDYYGGELRRGLVDDIPHYWNILEEGRQVDLTLKQFGDCARPSDVRARDRDYVLSFPETVSRYERLRSAVDRYLTSS
jgi:hypothetical protein